MKRRDKSFPFSDNKNVSLFTKKANRFHQKWSISLINDWNYSLPDFSLSSIRWFSDVVLDNRRITTERGPQSGSLTHTALHSFSISKNKNVIPLHLLFHHHHLLFLVLLSSQKKKKREGNNRVVPTFVKKKKKRGPTKTTESFFVSKSKSSFGYSGSKACIDLWNFTLPLRRSFLTASAQKLFR